MSCSKHYIAFEGIDASGKSTQVELFCSLLKRKGDKVYCTKEPGGTPIGEKIRNILLNEDISPKVRLFMFLADRTLHIKTIKKLPDEYIVVSDRSLFSTLAYQSFGEGLDIEFVETANRFATDGLLPDITFIIDIDIDTMEKRIKKMDAIESKGKDFFARVRNGYKYIAKKYKNVYLIDGEKPKEEVFEDIIEIWNSL